MRAEKDIRTKLTELNEKAIKAEETTNPLIKGMRSLTPQEEGWRQCLIWLLEEGDGGNNHQS